MHSAADMQLGALWVVVVAVWDSKASDMQEEQQAERNMHVPKLNYNQQSGNTLAQQT